MRRVILMAMGMVLCICTNSPIMPDDTVNNTDSTYTITFNANGGTVSPTFAKTGTNGKLASLPVPTRESYTFKGWYTAASNGEAVSTNRVYSANTTIYAQWAFVFVDSRDDRTYRKATIGTQVWMAENLNYDIPDDTTDMCYEKSADSCAKYGRLYSWATAMGIDMSYNDSYLFGSDANHQGVCPSGWHLPNNNEWGILTNHAGGASGAGKKLKSTSGWLNNGNGTDEYGFSALPSGYGRSDGVFGNAGCCYGYWWSASNIYNDSAWCRFMRFSDGNMGSNYHPKTSLYSVRCVQD